MTPTPLKSTGESNFRRGDVAAGRHSAVCRRDSTFRRTYMISAPELKIATDTDHTNPNPFGG